MKIWKVQEPKTVFFMANRREGLNALKKCLKKPYDSWTLQAFFGLYITEYEDRY
jgi:hypothetical protein